MMYPVMFVINPFMNWIYMVYGIFTAGQRTWGGPRADAGKADEKTTATEAIAKAEAAGDDLNVVPETFRFADEAAFREAFQRPLMPSSHLAGRFAPAEELPGGYYRQGNDSGVLHSDMTRREPETGPCAIASRRESSTDSFMSSTSSIYPRRVESIFEPADTLSYFAQQALQRPPGGARFEADRPRHRDAPPISLGNRRHGQRRRSVSPGLIRGRPLPKAPDQLQLDLPFHRRRSASIDSLRSNDTGSTVSMHFHVPAYHRAAVSGSEPHHQPTHVFSAAQHEAKRAASPVQRRSSAPESSNRTGPAPSLDIERASRWRPQSHNGRSPLARKSLIRLATDRAASGSDAEGGSRMSRRLSSEEERGAQRRGRRRTPTAYGSDGRRRLSKRSRAPSSKRSSKDDTGSYAR